MSTHKKCDLSECGQVIGSLAAFVTLPAPLGGIEFHYHVNCWAELQRKAENSNPSQPS